MTGAMRNDFCFPSTKNVPLSFASGKTEGLRETKLTVSLGASHAEGIPLKVSNLQLVIECFEIFSLVMTSSDYGLFLHVI